MSVDDNKKVSLIIGVNCVRALESREVISNHNRGLFAIKSLLGWCVVGPVVNQTVLLSVTFMADIQVIRKMY